MKKCLIVCISVMLLLSFSFNAMAADKASDKIGLYVGVIGGYAIPTSSSNTNTDGSLAYKEEMKYKNGFLVGFKFGYIPPALKKILAVEVEYNFKRVGLDKYDETTSGTTGGLPASLVADYNADGNISTNSIFFNIMARYPEGRVHPYVGIGPGISRISVGEITLTGNATLSFPTVPWSGTLPLTMRYSSFDDTRFAYQVLAGVDIDITKSLAIGIGYKYHRVDGVKGNPTYTMTSGGLSFTGVSDLKFDYATHDITIGLNYYF